MQCGISGDFLLAGPLLKLFLKLLQLLLLFLEGRKDLQRCAVYRLLGAVFRMLLHIGRPQFFRQKELSAVGRKFSRQDAE